MRGRIPGRRQAPLLALAWLLMLAGCSDRAGSENETQATGQPAAEGAVADADSRPVYSARTFFETISYSLSGANAWSHDGSRLLVGSDETGTYNVYALAADGSGRTALTAATDTAQRPVSWFPDDDRVLFMADNAGDELTHLYVRETDGTIVDLTPGELKAQFGGWIDDGAAFIVGTNERDAGAFDVYRYSVKDYSRSLVFENTAGFLPAATSRDGRHLALVRVNSNADNDLYLADLDAPDEAPVHLTPHDGDISHQVYEFTPDDRALIFGTNAHGEFVEAWSHDIESGEQTRVVASDWDVVFLSYSESGRYRIIGTNEDARIVVQVVDTTTNGEVTLPGLPPGDPAQIRFSPDEQRIALTVSTDTSPSDIYVVDRAAGTSRRLTTASNPAIDENELVASRVIRYPSFDGLEIPGILYQPRQASPETPVPALVWVHGGPGGQSGRGYNATLQHLVNHGYAVLAANNRGSSGYGKTFFHLDDQRHGEVDLDDIVHAQKYLAGLNWVDGGRIGIIGGSYGGYMVGAALTFRPEVFQVGIDIFGVMNWIRTLESIPPWWEANKRSLYQEMGDPTTDAERLRRISPLFHAEHIQVPLLVVQGANDPRVLKVESDEIVAAARANEVPVEYVVFEDEGHGFAQRENRITASDAYVEFLEKYL